jgi:hypothetical protein
MGEPQAAKLAVGGRLGDLRKMLARKRLQSHPALAGQQDRFDETAHETLLTADQAETIAHTDNTTARTAAAPPRYSP